MQIFKHFDIKIIAGEPPEELAILISRARLFEAVLR